MTAPRAADLPVGSIVATSTHAWIKVDGEEWLATGFEHGYSNEYVQHAIDNNAAQVLRVGDGSSTP